MEEKPPVDFSVDVEDVCRCLLRSPTMMTVKVDPGNHAILSVHYAQNYAVGTVGIGLLAGTTGLCLAKGGMLAPVGLMLSICLVWLVGQLLSKRELWCVIDKAAGRVAYVRGGVLGSRYGARVMEYPFAEILVLEMERYRRRNRFQLRLILMGNRILPLSAGDLEFDECQSFVDKICQFMGAEIPVRVID